MKTLELQRMPSDCIRLHFWDENKSCYVITDCIGKAKKEMLKEYDNVSIATSQDAEITYKDLQLYYL